jgi:hypothetical protein
MRTPWIAALVLALAAGSAAADDQKPEKKQAAKSDKNVFQKAESSVGDWANRNKIWVTRKKKKDEKK